MQPSARVAKLVDAADLKSAALHRAYGFDSRPGHQTVVVGFFQPRTAICKVGWVARCGSMHPPCQYQEQATVDQGLSQRV